MIVELNAEATGVDVLLERRGEFIVLIIEDNGKGFDTGDENNSKGIGLLSMRERASLIGGTVEIESAIGKGTSIFVRVPERHAHEKEQSTS